MPKLSLSNPKKTDSQAQSVAPDYAAKSVPGYDEASSKKRDSARVRERASISQGAGALLTEDGANIGPDYGYRRLRLHKNEEVDLYGHERDASHALTSPGKACLILAVALVIVYLAAVALPPSVFDSNVGTTTFATWFASVQRRLGAFFSYITFQGGSYSIDFTANRYLIIALGGAALALSGAVYQGSLKNSLASPSTLGVMQGANTGRIVYVLFFYSASYSGVSQITRASEIQKYFDSLNPLEYILALYGDSLCCLIGSAIVVVFVLLIAHVSSQRGISNIVMIITGQIIATLLGAFVSLVQFYMTETGDGRLELIRSLQTEAFSNSMTKLDVVVAGVPIIICIVAILILGSRLNILSFSEEEARSMGVNTTGLRWLMVGLCTVLTAVVVAFCGNVGMVGFVIPHAVRRIVGPNFKYLLPASMLAGALFLIVVFCGLSMFSESAAFNIGTFTSVIGGVIFIAIALKQRGDARDAWV